MSKHEEKIESKRRAGLRRKRTDKWLKRLRQRKPISNADLVLRALPTLALTAVAFFLWVTHVHPH